jgi:hypothetical protein
LDPLHKDLEKRWGVKPSVRVPIRRFKDFGAFKEAVGEHAELKKQRTKRKGGVRHSLQMAVPRKSQPVQSARTTSI